MPHPEKNSNICFLMCEFFTPHRNLIHIDISIRGPYFERSHLFQTMIFGVSMLLFGNVGDFRSRPPPLRLLVFEVSLSTLDDSMGFPRSDSLAINVVGTQFRLMRHLFVQMDGTEKSNIQPVKFLFLRGWCR